MLSSNFTCTSFLGRTKAYQPIILLLFGMLLVLRYLYKAAFSKQHEMFQVRISNLWTLPNSHHKFVFISAWSSSSTQIPLTTLLIFHSDFFTLSHNPKTYFTSKCAVAAIPRPRGPPPVHARLRQVSAHTRQIRSYDKTTLSATWVGARKASRKRDRDLWRKSSSMRSKRPRIAASGRPTLSTRQLLFIWRF